jgi:hypothetical protein
MANQFEKDFEAKFPIIRKRTGAYLYRLWPPMRIAGMRGSMPSFVQVGRALFDVAGWHPRKDMVDGLQQRSAIAIGIELKDTKDRHSSLRIVGDDGSGSGIQAHQLEALAAVHRDGGIARVLWSNGGQVGVLDGEEIVAAHFTYGVSVQAEKMRKKPALGSRSIPWSLFREVDFINKPEEIVIAPPKEPTLAERVKKTNAKASKQIEEAEDDDVDSAPFEDMLADN